MEGLQQALTVVTVLQHMEGLQQALAVVTVLQHMEGLKVKAEGPDISA